MLTNFSIACFTSDVARVPLPSTRDSGPDASFFGRTNKYSALVVAALTLACNAGSTQTSASGGAFGLGGKTASAGGDADAAGQGGIGGARVPAGDHEVWPNSESHANSDAWLVNHHEEIRQMRPRVLLLDFLENGSEAQVREKAEQVIEALAEGSRFHRLENPDAPAFLQYQISRVVSLPGQAPRSNGAWGYAQLMTGAAFAEKVGFADPISGQILTVCEQFERGYIHEVWVAENPSDPEKLYEFKARSQCYDVDSHKADGDFDSCAGNGCIIESFDCGVTVRLAEINVDRGPGCATHAYGHGIENQVLRDQIPYFTDNAERFFNFNLPSRYDIPISNFYSCPYNDGSPLCLEYPESGRIESGPALPDSLSFGPLSFGDGCGNTHFAPHSRFHYDFESGSVGSALATCRSYGLGDDSGLDPTERISYESYRAYNEDPRFTDCGGGWQLFLRQNMPGLDNQARDVDGGKMKNWWPFLFY